MNWRARLRMNKSRRAKYEALHDAVAGEVENDRLEAQVREIPDAYYDIPRPDAFVSKADRRAERHRTYAQTGAVD